jgi:hypothetical protein
MISHNFNETDGSGMKPVIDKSRFGSITIEGEKYKHDVVIKLDGTVVKRKKKLSKEIYGTSHKFSLQEAQHVYQEGAVKLLIGSGQIGMVELTDEANEFLKAQACEVEILPTPQAIKRWNESPQDNVLGLFHVTC